MKNFCLVFEYDCKKFMHLDKIIKFKKNLKKVQEKGNEVKLVFYGEAINEELATFMSYFTSLAGKNVCDIAISFKTKDLVINKGINNKSIKRATLTAKEIKNKQFNGIIDDFYKEGYEIRVLPNINWESIILDLIGE